MPDQRPSFYLPLTLAERVEEARKSGHPVNISEAAQRDIAAALNSHAGSPAGPDGHHDQDQHCAAPEQLSERLDAIEQRMKGADEKAGQLAQLVRQAAVLIVLCTRAREPVLLVGRGWAVAGP